MRFGNTTKWKKPDRFGCPAVITGKRGASYGLFRTRNKDNSPNMTGDLFAMKAGRVSPRLLGRSEWVRDDS